MSTAVKRPQPKPVRVAPTVTDPSMRNTRGPAEMLLNSETGGDQPDDHETVFGGTQKTKEEQDATQPESSQNSTMLIVVFALIVIALVALIVWMLMKQSNDKKDEEEMRKMIQPQPHPRNNMPPGYGPQGQMQANQRMQGNQAQPGQLQMSPADFEAHQRNMALMHQQQAAMQQHMAQMNADLVDADPTQQPQSQSSKKSKKSKSFAEVMAEKDGKVIPPLKEPLLDEEEPAKKPKFTKKNPHPGILRPGGSEFQSDVDDVLEQTSTMLQSSKASKSGKSKAPSKSGKKSVQFDKSAKSKKEELTDLDKALLDKVNSNADDQDDDEDTQV